ncbi:unnamed protein product [Acanthosepion pharaonis]|uniref:Uncharacterized protein n=1 Tax=Acanthosepion pharaonis TaxID=158019 RepID=A0A812BTQ8_ACAPH|nr:unnamed protein product [Sepia pharaonis]
MVTPQRPAHFGSADTPHLMSADDVWTLSQPEGCYQRDPIGGGPAPFPPQGPSTPPLDGEAFGYLKRVIVTPAVYPRLVEFLHFDIQSTGQKSHRVSTGLTGARAACARTQVEAYTRRLPEEGLEAVALHEDPGEEPFCSPADAPVATGWRRERRPVAHATRERGQRRERKTTSVSSEERVLGVRERRIAHRQTTRYESPPDARTRAPRERSERYSPVPVPRFTRARPDRPGPRSQSFFRRYGSILPTSLTYIDAIDERLYTLETCCGWWVRTDSRAAKTGPGFSRAAESAPDAARAAALYRYLFRISGRADSTDTVLYEEERTLPGALGDVSGLACVTAVSPEKRRDATDIAASSAATPGHSPSPGSGILTRFPFDGRPAVRHSRRFDRLTRARPPLARNPSPLRSSKVSFEYLLLPPRSAPAVGSTRARALGFRAHRGALLLVAASVRRAHRFRQRKALPRRDGPASVRRPAPSIFGAS